MSRSPLGRVFGAVAVPGEKFQKLGKADRVVADPRRASSPPPRFTRAMLW